MQVGFAALTIAAAAASSSVTKSTTDPLLIFITVWSVTQYVAMVSIAVDEVMTAVAVTRGEKGGQTNTIITFDAMKRNRKDEAMWDNLLDDDC